MNQGTPKVSILMSVYNGERYVEASLISILAQTFVDFELLIVDDGSTDSTLSLIEAFASRDTRIRLVKNQINMGLTKSLNRGIQSARGKYLARQDVDDISLPDRLTVQLEFMDTHSEIGAVGSAAQTIDELGTLKSADREYEAESLPLTAHTDIQAYLLLNNCLYHSSMTMRTELVRAMGGYDESLRYSQDYDLWWRIGQLKNIAVLPTPLVQIRRSDESITQKKREQQLDCAYKISLRIFQDLVGINRVNEAAYQRFWWAVISQLDRPAYKNIWIRKHKGEGMLTAKDIKNLAPVWNALSLHSGSAKVWGNFLLTLSQRLLNERRTSTGLQLLYMTRHYLKTNIQWDHMTKALIRPYVRPK